jgi:hypothetical protein
MLGLGGLNNVFLRKLKSFDDSQIKPFYGRRTAELAKAHHITLF